MTNVVHVDPFMALRQAQRGVFAITTADSDTELGEVRVWASRLASSSNKFHRSAPDRVDRSISLEYITTKVGLYAAIGAFCESTGVDAGIVSRVRPPIIGVEASSVGDDVEVRMTPGRSSPSGLVSARTMSGIAWALKMSLHCSRVSSEQLDEITSIGLSLSDSGYVLKLNDLVVASRARNAHDGIERRGVSARRIHGD